MWAQMNVCRQNALCFFFFLPFCFLNRTIIHNNNNHVNNVHGNRCNTKAAKQPKDEQKHWGISLWLRVKGRLRLRQGASIYTCLWCVYAYVCLNVSCIKYVFEGQQEKLNPTPPQKIKQKTKVKQNWTTKWNYQRLTFKKIKIINTNTVQRICNRKATFFFHVDSCIVGAALFCLFVLIVALWKTVIASTDSWRAKRRTEGGGRGRGI